MAVSYVARKCTQCGGKLENIIEKKTWKCLYCGAEVERTEQYDGLFTIKNVVRQALLDVSYRRLDSAEKNLVECEKIDSRYIGTIIAKIVYQMILAITPGACPQSDLRNMFTQLKRNYEALCAIDKKINDDEEALYEFFDSADIYATLLLVYDSLNDVVRRDYVAGLLNAREVYAKEPNKNLLSYALKNSKFDLIDEIMGNSNNVEPDFAFGELLQKYPDNENKVKNIENLIKSQTFKDDDKKLLENYLADSEDSLSTKGKIVVLAYSANIRGSLENIIKHLISKAEIETVKQVLNQICSTRLTDEETYKILEFSVYAKTVDIACSALKILKDTSQYVLIIPKYLIALLSRDNITADNKTAILKNMLEFSIDAKSKDAVISHYLCFNKDLEETRLSVIPVLLSMVSEIQTGTVENYILKTNTDGANKFNIANQIFSLDLNMSYFNDLLVKYMNSSTDIKEVKDEIVDLLVSKGLKIDPKAFLEYICYSTDLAKNKADFVKKMLSNGAQMRSDTVNTYLEYVNSENFNSEVLSLIISSAINISEKALSNYLLNCKEVDHLKVKNFSLLAKQCNTSIASISCETSFSGQKISGNLLQVYLLATPDSFEVTKEILDYLVNCKAKLNTDIQSSIMGVIKLKKFVLANQNRLSLVTGQICSELQNPLKTSIFGKEGSLQW